MRREETRERRRGEISVIRERRGKGEMAVTRRDDVAEIRKRKRRIAVIRGKETRGRRAEVAETRRKEAKGRRRGSREVELIRRKK